MSEDYIPDDDLLPCGCCICDGPLYEREAVHTGKGMAHEDCAEAKYGPCVTLIEIPAFRSGTEVFMKKTEKLKPRVLDSIRRLQKFVEIDAPAPIIGAEVWMLFRVTLAAYGTSAGMTMLSDIMEHEFHNRAICGNGDCDAYVERPGVGICEPCQKELGIDDASLDALDKTASCEHDILLTSECLQCATDRVTLKPEEA